MWGVTDCWSQQIAAAPQLETRSPGLISPAYRVGSPRLSKLLPTERPTQT